MDKKPIISVKKLSVAYFLGKSNQVNALTDASLEIYPGEFVIFFGPSGCGKSTLLYAISGLERNITGDIFIDGKNIRTFDDHELDYYRRKKIGMVFQAYYLINSLTILENVVLPQMSEGTDRASRNKKAKELLDFFGVGVQAKKFPNELSGGQQQRAAICRALMNEPEIILADEPTGNLDSKSTQDVMEVLRDLNEKKGKTVILVTHSPAMLEYADKIFYMKDGRIIGTKENKHKHPGKVEAGNLPVSNLEMVSRAFTDTELNKKGGLLSAYKAKQIVFEALTGMNPDEIAKIEEKVIELFNKGDKRGEELAQYLDKELAPGVIDINKKKAEALAEKIERVIEDIENFEKDEMVGKNGLVPDKDKKVKMYRQHILDSLNIELHNPESLERLNEIIADRVAGKIDLKETIIKLDEPLKRGGAGLDRRDSRKLGRRLELLVKSDR